MMVEPLLTVQHQIKDAVDYVVALNPLLPAAERTETNAS
jgi:hypothetical protein